MASKLPKWATWTPNDDSDIADFNKFSNSYVNNNDANFNSLRYMDFKKNLSNGDVDVKPYYFNPNRDKTKYDMQYKEFKNTLPAPGSELNTQYDPNKPAGDGMYEKVKHSAPQKEKQGVLGSIGSGLTQGLAEGEKNFLNMVKTPYKLMSNGIAKALNYDNSNNVVLKGFNKADTTYNNVINDEANKDRSKAANVAFKGGNIAGNGAVLAAEMALPVPKAGNLGNVYSESVGQLGNLASNSILKSGLKAGAEMGTMGAVEKALTLPDYEKPVTNQDVLNRYKDIGTSGLEGAASGFAFGAGGKALGQGLRNLKDSALPSWETTFEDNVSNHLKKNGELIPKNTVSEVNSSPVSKLQETKLPILGEPIKTVENNLNSSNTNTPLVNKKLTMNLQAHSGMNLNAMHEGMLDIGDKEMFKERTGREATSKDMKDRQGIVNSFMNSEAIPDEVKAKLKEDPQSYKYIEHNNEQAMNNAREEVANSFDKVKTHIENLNSLENDQDTARALEVERQLIKDGDFEGAKQWSLKVARLGTKSGQAIQYFSTLKRMTPEWTLNHVQNMIDKTLTPKQRTIIETAKPEEVDTIAKKFKIPHLSDEATKKLVDMSNKISELPEGRGKDEAISNLQQYAYDQVPHSILSYINSVQTNAMLSSPKTSIRNIVSNLIFGGITDAKNSVRTGLDKGIGAFTKERTSTLPSLPQKIKGFTEGTKESLLDFKNNVDTRNTDKMELTRGSVWNKNGNLLNKSMYNIEKTNKLLLSDRGFEGSAYNDEFTRQKKLAKLNGVEFDETKADAKAKQAALYQTFNDENKISNMAVGLKRLANGGKEWGAGDVILKFAKTPANITARAIDYSPVAFVRAIKAGVSKDGFNQEKFTDELAKGITGGGLIALGGMLHKLGVLNTDKEKNYNAQALRAKAGLGNFQINLSALNRKIRGGDTKLQKGDLHITYDWSAPTSVLLALGAELSSSDKNITSKAESLLSGLTNGLNGLIEQPMTQGLQTLFGSHNVSEAALKFVASLPQTFVPSLLNNFKQLSTNNAKETYSPSLFKKGLNQAANRIPGNTLPKAVDIMGQDKRTMQNNNLFNVFLNPANTTRYSPDKNTENALNLYNKVGGGDVLPKLAPKSLLLDGKSYKLPTPVYQQYQRDLGNAANEIYSNGDLSEKQASSLLLKASKQAKENAIKGLGLPLPEKKTTSKGHSYKPGK